MSRPTTEPARFLTQFISQRRLNSWQKGPLESAPLSNRRSHKKLERHKGGNWVPGQTEDQLLRSSSQQYRFSWSNRDLVKHCFEGTLFHGLVNIVTLTHRDSPRENQHVGLQACFHGFPSSGKIVGNHRKNLAGEAEGPTLALKHPRIRISNLAKCWLFVDIDNLIAGGKYRNCGQLEDRRPRTPEAGQYSDFRRSDCPTPPHDNVSLSDLGTHPGKILSGLHALQNLDRVLDPDRFLDHLYGVAPGRDWSAGHDLGGLPSFHYRQLLDAGCHRGYNL